MNFFSRYQKEQAAATARVNAAVHRGELTRPTICELCSVDVTQPSEDEFSHPRIVAHHYRGYDHPLDVWWICARCNRILKGKHDGSLTKDQAREYIRNRGVENPRTLEEILKTTEYYQFIGRMSREGYARFVQDANAQGMEPEQLYSKWLAEAVGEEQTGTF